MVKIYCIPVVLPWHSTTEGSLPTLCTYHLANHTSLRGCDRHYNSFYIYIILKNVANKKA